MEKSAAKTRAVAVELASQSARPDLSISFNDPARRFVYRTLSSDTGAAVNQFPHENALRRMAAVRAQAKGVFIDRLS